MPAAANLCQAQLRTGFRTLLKPEHFCSSICILSPAVPAVLRCRWGSWGAGCFAVGCGWRQCKEILRGVTRLCPLPRPACARGRGAPGVVREDWGSSANATLSHATVHTRHVPAMAGHVLTPQRCRMSTLGRCPSLAVGSAGSGRAKPAFGGSHGEPLSQLGTAVVSEQLPSAAKLSKSRQ